MLLQASVLFKDELLPALQLKVQYLQPKAKLVHKCILNVITYTKLFTVAMCKFFWENDSTRMLIFPHCFRVAHQSTAEATTAILREILKLRRGTNAIV